MELRRRTAALLVALSLPLLAGAGCGTDDVDLPEEVPTEDIPTELPEEVPTEPPGD